eukprot:182531_1
MSRPETKDYIESCVRVALYSMICIVAVIQIIASWVPTPQPKPANVKKSSVSVKPIFRICSLLLCLMGLVAGLDAQCIFKLIPWYVSESLQLCMLFAALTPITTYIYVA